VNEDTPEKTRTILVVDDDAGMVKAMQAILKKSGFASIGCLTAADALDKAVAGVNAAVVDIHLPDMSGLALTQQLRTVLGPEMPIVILSGDTSMETLRALPEIGATHFFSKPVNTGMLIGRLREWTGIA
jgi:DNA-binding response OmpR family regulator